MFKYYHHLAFTNPYSMIKEGKIDVKRTFPEIISLKNDENIIDPVSVIELMNKISFLQTEQ